VLRNLALTKGSVVRVHHTGVLLTLVLIGGCLGRDRGAPSVSAVGPLSEAEFDRFASRIADRVVQVLQLRGERGAVDIRGPAPAAGGVEPPDTAELFAANLGEALNDRLIGVARVSPADAAGVRVDGPGLNADPVDAPPQLTSSIAFSRIAAAADARPAQNVVTFVLTDARDGAELFRESAPYEAGTLARRTGERVVRVPQPGPPGQQGKTDRAATNLPPRQPPVTATAETPEGPPVDTASTAEEVEASRAAATVQRPALRRMPAGGLPPVEQPPGVMDDSQPPAGWERPPPEVPFETVRKQRIRIDRSARGLAEFVKAQLPLHEDRVIPGADGSVVFVDDDAWRRFRLLGQRSLRTPDGKMRVELDIRARERRRAARLRIAFIDADGRQTEVSPVIGDRFTAEYTRTVLFTTVGTRSTAYFVLFADD
jgi:hypothetical protein